MSILVVGALHLDVVVNAPRLPVLDETLTGSGVAYNIGGKGGNQALAIAQLGGKVAFAGRIGSDSFGTSMRETLQGSSVDISQLQQDDGASGMSAAIVDANGEYGAVIVSASNLRIDAGKIVVAEGTAIVLLQNEIPEEINLAIAAQAREAGASIWMNAAPARPINAKLQDALDLMIVNRLEEAFYPNLVAEKTVATRGRDGVHFAGKHHPAFDVAVHSTHGAGDMFVGALAMKVAAGSSIEDALPFAQAAAALHVTSSLDDRASIDTAMVTRFLETGARLHDHPAN